MNLQNILNGRRSQHVLLYRQTSAVNFFSLLSGVIRKMSSTNLLIALNVIMDNNFLVVKVVIKSWVINRLSEFVSAKPRASEARSMTFGQKNPKQPLSMQILLEISAALASSYLTIRTATMNLKNLLHWVEMSRSETFVTGFRAMRQRIPFRFHFAAAKLTTVVG